MPGRSHVDNPSVSGEKLVQKEKLFKNGVWLIIQFYIRRLTDGRKHSDNGKVTFSSYKAGSFLLRSLVYNQWFNPLSLLRYDGLDELKQRQETEKKILPRPWYHGIWQSAAPGERPGRSRTGINHVWKNVLWYRSINFKTRMFLCWGASADLQRYAKPG